MKKHLKLFMIITISLLVFGCKKEIEPIIDDKESSVVEKETITLKELWNKLEGYWTLDQNEFVYFINEVNPQISFGVWYAGGGRKPGLIKEYKALENNKYEITVFYEEEPETMVTGAYEEETVYLSLDLSNISQKKVIIETQEKKTFEYIYSGKTAEESLEKLEY